MVAESGALLGLRMKLTAEHYFQAARDRIKQAQALYLQGTGYALTMYDAGVAVECMLRAFKLRHDATYDERHDLERLFRASGMLRLSQIASAGRGAGDQGTLSGGLRQAVNAVAVLWSNDYRYASEDRLRAHLRNLQLHRGIKGNVLKANALRLLKAAQRIVAEGEQLWPVSERK